MSLLPIGIGSAEAGGYQIERSLRFNSADSAYLNRTPASAGNRRTWTWSGWTKITPSSTARFFAARVDDNNRFIIALPNTQNNLQVSNVISGTSTVWVATNALLRDPSAWYHIVVAFDSTQATATNRLKVYLNGVEQTFSTDNRSSISQNYDGYVNNNIAHYIGTATTGAGNFSDKYLTEINFIDGSALTPSSFGETDTDTGVWKPKAYSGSYGTNGFYLKFADNSGTTSTTLGKDSSGNGNNWTPNNFSVTAGAGNDSLVDSPTRYGTDTGAGGEVRGNYCTFNPVDSYPGNLFDGNLRYTDTSGNVEYAAGTMAFDIGTQSVYWEAAVATLNHNNIRIGIIPASINTNSDGVNLNEYAYYGANGNKVNNGSLTSYGASFNSSDVVGIKCGSGQIEFFKNNVSQGVAFSGLSGLFKPSVSAAANADAYFNFGQRPFAFSAPSGFKALVTTNLP